LRVKDETLNAEYWFKSLVSKQFVNRWCPVCAAFHPSSGAKSRETHYRDVASETKLAANLAVCVSFL
jgi:hypothetical protein